MSTRINFSQEISREIAEELGKLNEREFPKNDNGSTVELKKKPSVVFLVIFACIFLWYVGKPSSKMVVMLTMLASAHCYLVLVAPKSICLNK